MTLLRLLLIVVALIAAQTGPSSAQHATQSGLAPTTNRGAPWKLGYVETGSFVNYAATLANLAYALKDMGWIGSVEGLPYAPQQTNSRIIWDWLATHGDSPYIHFVKDGYYSYDGLRGADVKAASLPIINRLKTTNDIDLMLVMGTDAGQTMAVNEHRIPQIVMSTSNAVQAKIVKSAEDPGYEHVWAHMDPLRYRRQIDIFYDIFRFRTLGVVYDNDTAGKSFAAIEDLEAAARAKGFQIAREFVAQPQKYGADKQRFYADLRAAHERLAQRSDAVYFGLFIGIDPLHLPEVFAPLTQSRTPVFAQQANDVRTGALMSLARLDFKGVGRFNAETIAKVFNGQRLRTIPQVFENSPNIIINLEVAKAIGYRPRFDVLLAADELVAKIQ